MFSPDRRLAYMFSANAVTMDGPDGVPVKRGYDQVFVEDAMAARTADEHAHTIRTVFTRIGRVRSTAEVLAALEVAIGQA